MGASGRPSIACAVDRTARVSSTPDEFDTVAAEPAQALIDFNVPVRENGEFASASFIHLTTNASRMPIGTPPSVPADWADDRVWQMQQVHTVADMPARARDDIRSPSPTNAVPVGDAPLTVADVVRVADGAVVELTPSGLAKIEAARAVVDRLVTGDRLIYGLNTGLGHMRDTRIPLEALREYQEAIVLAHCGGIGPPLPARVVRAAMVVRVAGAATGGAGISPPLVLTLVEMLNRGVTPVVPSLGSVGASDLMHMAAIAVVAAGLGGLAELNGVCLPGPQAMRKAGIRPPRLEPKDGLALISANGVAIGHAALVAARALVSANTADVALAASFEAIAGNTSIVDPVVVAAKPAAGQRTAGAHIRELLDGSEQCLPTALGSVQDPLSFRVGPQVHGAFRDLIEWFVQAIEVELAASDDNPYVSIDEDRLISNGNFHPIGIALAADAIRPAIAHVGLLSTNRTGHLWAADFANPELTTPTGLRKSAERGALLLRYAGAARYSELRGLAAPATLDIPALDQGVEDHATNAPASVDQVNAALDRLDDLLAIELILARGAIARAGREGGLGHGVAAALDELDAVVESVGKGASSEGIQRAVVAALHNRIGAAADSAAVP
jgi:histidine ammonia-lyase